MGLAPRVRGVTGLIAAVAVVVAVLFSVSFSVLGCASMPIPGGKVVNHEYRPQIVIGYSAEGETAPGTRHFLVQDGPGLAFFEQESDGGGTVLQRHWADASGDHFAVWGDPLADPRPAVEVLVPVDHRQPAYRFVYEPGLYEVRQQPDGPRPVPRMLIEASTKLYPQPR